MHINVIRKYKNIFGVGFGQAPTEKENMEKARPNQEGEKGKARLGLGGRRSRPGPAQKGRGGPGPIQE